MNHYPQPRPLGVSIVAIWFLLSSLATVWLFFRLPKSDGWQCLILFTALVGIWLSFGLWRMARWARRATLICTGLSLILDWTGIFPSNLNHMLQGSDGRFLDLRFWDTWIAF